MGNKGTRELLFVGPTSTGGTNGSSPGRDPIEQIEHTEVLAFGYTFKARKMDAQDVIIRNLRRTIFAEVVLAVLGVVFMIIELELRWNAVIREGFKITLPLELLLDCLKLVVSLSTVALLVALYIEYKYMVQMEHLRKRVPIQGGIWAAGLGWYFCYEVAACALHCPPALYVLFGYNVENLLSVLMLTRVYVLLKPVSANSILLSSTGRYIRAMSTVELSFPLFMRNPLIYKIYLTTKPLTCLLAIFTSTILLSAYAAWVFERHLVLGTDDIRLYFHNMLWMMLITVFTVGYGDIFPLSSEGRIVVVVTAAIGLILTALIIAIFQQQIAMSEKETKIVDFIVKQERQRQLKKAAIHVMQTSYLFWKAHKQDKPPRDLLKCETRMYKAIAHWRLLKRIVADDRRNVTDAEPSIDVAPLQREIAELTQRLIDLTNRLDGINTKDLSGKPFAPSSPERLTNLEQSLFPSKN